MFRYYIDPTGILRCIHIYGAGRIGCDEHEMVSDAKAAVASILFFLRVQRPPPPGQICRAYVGYKHNEINTAKNRTFQLYTSSFVNECFSNIWLGVNLEVWSFLNPIQFIPTNSSFGSDICRHYTIIINPKND